MPPNLKAEIKNDPITRSYGSLRVEDGGKMEGQPTKKRFGFIPHWYFSELWEVFNIAWSMCLIAICYMLMFPLSLIFVGQQGTKYLDGVGLANSILNIAAIMIGQGMSTACDTLFSQAYGSSNKKKVGVYLQRGLLIILLCSIPCIALLLNAESLLILLGQDPEISSIAGRYALVYIPALPAQFISSILNKYLRNQNIVRPMLGIGFAGLGVNALCQFIFVQQLNLGVEGAAMSQIFGFWTNAIGYTIYIMVSKLYKPTWDGWTMDIFQEWGSFFNLAIAGMLMISLQFWAFEIGTLVAGTLGDVQLAAQSIIFQMESITYMIPIGIGVGSTIRVGQLLGGQNPIQAKRAMIVGYTLAWMVGIVVVIVLVSLRLLIPRVFTQDSDVIELVGSLIPILALYHIFDATCGVSTGILRGCGRQTTAAAIVFVVMYFVGLPSALSMMLLTDLKSAGFWWGMTIALALEATAYLFSTFRTDWEEMTKRAQLRAGVRSIKNTEEDENESIDNDDLEETHISGDERTAILPKERTSQGRKTSYGVSPSRKTHNISITEMPEILTSAQIIFRRSTFVIFMLATLGLGIYIRLNFSFPKEMRSICLPGVPENGTLVNGTVIIEGNVSIPLCLNTTSL